MFSPITKHLKQIENKLHNNYNKIGKSELKDPSIKPETSFPFGGKSSPGVEHREDNLLTTPKLSRHMPDQLSTILSQIFIYQNGNEDPSADKLSILDEIEVS